MICVYFIKNINKQHIKIGESKNVLSRLAALQRRTSDKLELLGIIRDISDKLERELHKKFELYNVKNEWFKDCKEIQQFINDNCIQNPNVADLEARDADYKKLLKLIAYNIKYFRKNAHLTQVNMNKYNFNCRYYQRLESGVYAPSLATLYRLAGVFKIKMEDLFLERLIIDEINDDRRVP